MKRYSKYFGIIACITIACVITMNVMPRSVSAEEGATVIITGNEDNAPVATAETDAYVSGNKVIIVAPTAEAAPTAVPQEVTGSENSAPDQSTASIDLNNNETGEVVVEEEDDGIDYIVDDESDKKVIKTTQKPKTVHKNKSSVSQKKNVTEEDDIPKTGVVRMEFIFAGLGIVLLLVATWMSVKYLKSDSE